MKMITPLLEECWATDPCKRLTIVRLRKRIQSKLLAADCDGEDDSKEKYVVEST